MILCYRLYTPKMQVEILIPNVIGIRRWAFGDWLHHEGVALMIGISALVKGTPEDFLAPSAM